MTEGSARDLADEFDRTAKALGGHRSDRLTARELTMPRANFLVALLRHGPAKVAELALRVGISQDAAGMLTDVLIDDGLVVHRPDGRSVLRLTPAGEAAAQAWLAEYEQAAEDVFGALPANLRPTLIEALRTLADTTPTTATPAAAVDDALTADATPAADSTPAADDARGDGDAPTAG